MLTSKTKLSYAREEYGIPKTSYYRYLNEILLLLKMSTPKQVQRKFKEGKLSLSRIQDFLSILKLKTKGYATKLLPDKETLIVATAEMKNLASQPQQTKCVAASLNKLIQLLSNSQQGNKRMRFDLEPSSKMKFARCVIRHVNAKEPNSSGQVKTSKHGEVKVAGLSS